MNSLSPMMLYSAFGTTNLPKLTAETEGIKEKEFKKADKNQDNYLSFEEILKNDEVCSTLMTRINAIQGILATTKRDESELMKEKNLLKENPQNYPEFEGFNIKERKMMFIA